MNYWQKLCRVMAEPQKTEQALVDVFVRSLEEILGWSETEIVREFPVQVGHETKRGDVMLADCVIVEAKRQGIDLADAHILQQLKSYMRVKYKKFGFLLGSELWFFYDDYADTREDLKLIGSFGFEEVDNSTAVRLMEILAKAEFSVERLTDFCNQHWSGKYMDDLAGRNVARKVAGRGGRTQQSSEFWMKYWTDFQRQYQTRDEDGILARMEMGGHNDLFVRERVVKELFGRKGGIQFGLVKGNRPDMRKVEVRISKAETFRQYFAESLAEIVARIESLGGTYAPGNPEKVINCYFPVMDDTTASYDRIFEIYEGFKGIILDYYLERK